MGIQVYKIMIYLFFSKRNSSCHFTSLLFFSPFAFLSFASSAELHTPKWTEFYVNIGIKYPRLWQINSSSPPSMKRGLMDDPVKGKELSLDFVAEPSTLLNTSDGWTKEQPQTDTGQSRRGGEYCGWELKHVGWCGMIYYIVVQYVGLLRLLWSLLNGLLFHFNNNRAAGWLPGWIRWSRKISI